MAISLSQAFAQWQELAADIPQDDGPMLAESWNDYTDSLASDLQTFEYWADVCGFDTDSIKARAVYDECVAQSLKMLTAFGGKTLGELRELFQDM